MSDVNTTPPKLSLYEILKFWKAVNRTAGQGPEGTCWEWTQKRDAWGYGHFVVGNLRWRHLRASRFAFYLANKYWPQLLVLHTCDNPPCCNPVHLYEGGNDLNAQDRVNRNRLPRGDKHWSRLKPEYIPKGSKRSFAKLNDWAIVDIRQSVKNGATQVSLAQKYNVSRSLISLVVKERIWTHVKQL